MATITPQTTYPDGAALDIANHNANIYSVTPGRGVMSEPNGGLEQANLVAGFTVRAEHIMSEEAVSARAETTITPMDLFSNGFGLADDNDDRAYVGIGGLCQRVYIPFDISALVWEWSFFIAPFKVVVHDQEDYAGPSVTAAIDIRVEIDGVNYENWRRFPPNTAFSESVDSSTLINRERVGCTWYDLSLLQKQVSKGWHELAVKIYMERPRTPTDKDAIAYVPGSWFGPDMAGETPFVTLHSRTTFGTRSARAIMFK
jgi:hypothetical protein